MLARVCSFAAEEPKRVLVVHSFGSPAPPSTVHSMAFENALVSKMRERVDLNEVSSIIEAHSGTIMVEDTDGEQAQFTFTLPATDGSAK
jgi:pyruvoyl-dependent arginine decarboxylase (PvlArgDC)